MLAFDSAQASASTGTTSDRVLFGTLVVVSAKRLVIGVDVAAAKFLSGQRVDDLAREQEILKSMASTLKRSELRHPLGIEFFRDQIEAVVSHFPIFHVATTGFCMPSPCVRGGTTWAPSGDTIAVMQPPRSALRSFSSGEILAICASVRQPVALTTKQPDSNAWCRIVTSIWSAKIGPTSEPGNWLQ